MIWLAPWALIGLLAIAMPILIHLLGRGRAKTQHFPTLRFIERSRLLPTRRTRLHDLLLLLTRVAIIASAVIALAQPYWRTAARREAFEQTLARAIVFDTSASVRRVLTADSGQALADRLAGDANVHVQLAAVDVVDAIPGALAWLTQHAERRELVIVSDFQTGTLDAESIARIPAAVGVRLLRVGTGANAITSVLPVEAQALFGDNLITARTIAASSVRANSQAMTRDIEWFVRPDPLHSASSNDRATAVRVFAGETEQVRANAALAAARATSAEPIGVDSALAIVIVTLGYEQRRALLAQARAPGMPWMLDAIARLHSDATLREAASVESALPEADSAKGLILVRAADGRVAVTALEATIDARATLVLVTQADAGSLTNAALIVAARNALAATVSGTGSGPRVTMPSHAMLDELEPTQIADSVLRSWQRMPSAELRPPTGVEWNSNETVDGTTTDAFDGRWLWILALALLAVETWLRRRARTATADAMAP